MQSKAPEARGGVFDPERGPQAARAKANKPAKPLTQEESKNNTEEVVTLQMRRMKDGASARRSGTVPLTPFLLSVSRCQSPRGDEPFPSS